jgi:hypothetical protein
MPKIMNLKILVARRISKRLEREARVYRRALRDHMRLESGRIRRLEMRSRGLRLYAAWSVGASNIIQTRAQDWYTAALPQAAVEIDARTAAAG